MRSVLFALEWLPNYRLGFFEKLRNHLSPQSIDVRLIYGQPPSDKASRGTNATLEWAERRTNRTLMIGSTEFCWQPVLRDAREADLVVVQQEASLALNLLLAMGLRRGAPWAMWGHGQHFNPRDRSAIGERLKRLETARADWFFAYTSTSADAAAASGVPRDRITVVNNAVDALRSDGPPSEDVQTLVSEINRRTSNVGWMNSSLDRWKRIEFLCESLDVVRRECPDFEFIAVGDGEDRVTLERFSQSRPWVHVLGARFGSDKAALGRTARVMIHPGLVGLHVVEAFNFATPLVTTDIDYHSHEFAYLTPEEDGVVVSGDATPQEYGRAVVDLLADRRRLEAMAASGTEHAGELTVENMSRRFADGIVALLDTAGP